MVERIYPINVSYSFNKALYVKFDNKSTYKNLSSDNKLELRDKVIRYIIKELNDFMISQSASENFSFEILDDIEIKD